MGEWHAKVYTNIHTQWCGRMMFSRASKSKKRKKAGCPVCLSVWSFLKIKKPLESLSSVKQKQNDLCVCKVRVCVIDIYPAVYYYDIILRLFTDCIFPIKLTMLFKTIVLKPLLFRLRVIFHLSFRIQMAVKLFVVSLRYFYKWFNWTRDWPKVNFWSVFGYNTTIYFIFYKYQYYFIYKTLLYCI